MHQNFRDSLSSCLINIMKKNRYKHPKTEQTQTSFVGDTLYII